MNPCRWLGPDLQVTVRVQPRASRNGMAGCHGAALKVALTAPPVEGAANQALCQLLAKELGVAKSQATLVQGTTSRDKVVRIAHPAPTQVADFCQRHHLPPPAST